jgi:glyoxylase-like metal-dependent hydrolase (beta-lactamase superfamily II)
LFGKPIRITDGVFQLRAIGARVTVLAESGDALLIDSGLPGSSRIITRGLLGCGLTLDQIGRIVITHAHPDHWGGLAELVDKTGIAVAVHELEADIVEGGVTAPSPFRSRFLAALARPAMSRLTGEPVPVSMRLKDGDLISFPTEVRVVHLPGHTPGSIGLYLPDKGTVIVGDALQYKFGWRLYPPAPGVTQCSRTAMRSLEKLLSLDFHTICFSHFPPLRNNAKDALRQLVERHSDYKMSQRR